MSKIFDDFVISPIEDLTLWDNLVKSSLQSTIFHHSAFLNSFNTNVKKFLISKNKLIKAGFVIITDQDNTNIVNNDLIVHNGIFFIENKNQNEISRKIERIDIVDCLLTYLKKNFNSINITLSPKIDDLRPFVWFKNKFSKMEINIRHTLYLNIAELKNSLEFKHTFLYKAMQRSRRRQINEYENNNCSYVVTEDYKPLIDFYKKNFISQGLNLSNKKIEQIEKIIQNLLISKKGFVLNILSSEKNILYSIFFAFDFKRAYALFASGNKELENSYSGTMAYINSFIYIANKLKIYEVDLEGINSLRGGKFKMGFGGEIIKYFQFKI